MTDLKVSKGIYLICTVFVCIIKYQWRGNQYKNPGKKNNLYFKSQIIIKFVALALKELICFLKRKEVFNEK